MYKLPGVLCQLKFLPNICEGSTLIMISPKRDFTNAFILAESGSAMGGDR